jgi:hypothetical protein
VIGPEHLVMIKWGGACFGVVGAGLLAIKCRASGFGFVAYLASNAFWLASAIAQDDKPMLLMQVVFTLTSMLGVYRWLMLPWIKERQARVEKVIDFIKR